MNIVNSLITGISTIAISIASFFGINSAEYTKNITIQEPVEVVKTVEYTPENENLGATTPIAGSTFYLSGAGVSSSATSITLQSFTITQSPIDQKIQDGDLSDTFYLTLDPGNRTKQEIVGCTTVTQNSNGTATLSGCSRGLSPISDYTASTTLAFPHGGGAQAVFSNPPQLFNQYTAKANNEAITGYWTAPDPVSAQGIATRAYVAGQSFGGIGGATETATGTVEIATTLEVASSTTNGSIGRLAIAADTATDTPNTATKASRVIVSDLDGKIKNGWLDLTGYNGKASTTLLSASAESYLTGTSTLATTTITASKFLDSSENQVLWSLIASSTVTSGAATTTVNVPSKRMLRVFIDGKSQQNTGIRLYFNGDFGINYSYQMSTSTGLGTPDNFGTGKGYIPLSQYGSSFVSDVTIYNNPGLIKKIVFSTMGENYTVPGAFSTTTLPTMVFGGGIWATSTTQQIDTLEFFNSGGGGLSVGTTIYVYGSSF